MTEQAEQIQASWSTIEAAMMADFFARGRHIYRYDTRGAPAGTHPGRAILELAPDADWLIPESLFDCWTFVANAIDAPPAWVSELPRPTMTMLETVRRKVP